MNKKQILAANYKAKTINQTCIAFVEEVSNMLTK